jgi:hypothetical protein
MTVRAWRRPKAPVAAITVENLTVCRGGREILHGLSLAFEEGAITVIAGPAGALFREAQSQWPVAEEIRRCA